MNALVTIVERDGQQLVDARELHGFLENGKRFADWIKLRITQYGLVEGVDYSSFHQIVKREKGATTRTEYALTLTCAKELAMVEGNRKGKAARLYFIECERRLKADSLHSRVDVLEGQVASLQRQIAGLRPATTQPNPPTRHLPARQYIEFELVPKFFKAPETYTDEFWTVPQAISFLEQKTGAKKLNRYRVGKAMTRIAGRRFQKRINGKHPWGYSITLL
ncbi:hypothetical protein DYU11_11745 [Fibrisoma montanum]|uniref:AntA/AntB antirepressor domain-containing protein n=1 Tax=Fibrisoma montanum TaxID=2305895 RepID=A0A418MB99_9BACT|nr:antA/AntB antirepressor family protein [Fibrisoma montanum]RIV23647.1 hypothetical protein DYU11_11745 [Fibrisoma montanum]